MQRATSETLAQRLFMVFLPWGRALSWETRIDSAWTMRFSDRPCLPVRAGTTLAAAPLVVPCPATMAQVAAKARGYSRRWRASVGRIHAGVTRRTDRPGHTRATPTSPPLARGDGEHVALV